MTVSVSSTDARTAIFKPKIRALDGARGLAALLVVASHLGHRDLHLLGAVNLTGVGKSGVYLFFVLSAFLLTRPFLMDRGQMFGTDALINYGLRRFLRIYPLFILVLIVSWVVTTYLTPHLKIMQGDGIPFTMSGADVWAHLALMDGKSVLWSIVVEFKYYFVLPLVAWIYARWLMDRPLLGTLFFVAQLLLWALVLRPTDATENDIRLVETLPIFLFGSFAAYVSVLITRAPLHVQTRVMAWAPAIGWAAVIAYLFTIPSVYGWVSGGAMDYNAFHKDLLMFAIIWSLLVLATVHGRSLLTTVFEWPPLGLVGMVCFSIYLLHPSILKIVAAISPLPGFATAWLALALVICVAWLSFKVIEEPFIRITWFGLKQRMGASRVAA